MMDDCSEQQVSCTSHSCNKTVGTGGDWFPTFRLGEAWGDQQCIAPPPNFLAMIFKKQEILQQVVTRMQDLASQFSKNFPGVITQKPHSGRRRPPPAPNTQPSSTFQPWLHPWHQLSFISYSGSKTRMHYKNSRTFVQDNRQ